MPIRIRNSKTKNKWTTLIVFHKYINRLTFDTAIQIIVKARKFFNIFHFLIQTHDFGINGVNCPEVKIVFVTLAPSAWALHTILSKFNHGFGSKYCQ